MRKFLILVAALCMSSSFMKAQQDAPYLSGENEVECKRWVDHTLAKMNLKDRVGQLLIYTAPDSHSKGKKQISQLIKKFKIGGLSFPEGTMQDQAYLTNIAQSLSSVPMLITFDGERGLSSKLKDTPQFPDNAALGCIADNSLIEAYGREVARECKEMGIHVNFAPVADVNMNPRNPAINVRSFGEDPVKVADKVVAYAKGLESGGVLSVAKHFPGQGDTGMNPLLSFPIIPYSRARLDSVELYPFRMAIEAGLGGMMTGQIKVPALDPDRSLTASISPTIIQGVLKGELGFKGLVFADARTVKGAPVIPNISAKALVAGNDMILVSGNVESISGEILQAIQSGELTLKDIEEKCRKILSYKYMLAVKDRRLMTNPNGLSERINTPEAQELARKLRTSSITVLGNYGNVLPLPHLPEGIAVVSIGEAEADNDFISTLRNYTQAQVFRVTKENIGDTRQLTEVELPKYRRLVVCITAEEHEIESYAAFLSQLNPPAPIVYVFFTSYRTVWKLTPQLSKSAAIVLAHSPHADVQGHTAAMLFGQESVHGRLSMNIGDLFGTGDGVDITTNMQAGSVPEDYGMKSYIFSRGIDLIINDGLNNGAFPGGQVLVLKNGAPIYNKCFGTHSDKDLTPVRPTDMFDLGALTQTTATLLAIMKLYDGGKLNLTDEVSKYLPFLRATNKKNITIKELLFHESGLTPNIRFYRQTIDDYSVHGPFTQGFVDQWHHTQMGYYTYACSDFLFRKGLIAARQSATHSLHVAENMWIDKNFKNEAMQAIAKADMDRKRYVNCDAGYILLQQVVETIAGLPLDQYLARTFYAPMELARTMYLPLRQYGKEEIMPTATNDYMRRQDLCGYVHDESAAFLGGIAGNAGLFSTATELGQIYQMILNGGELDGKQYLSESTCRLFTTTVSSISHYGLGFNKPNPVDPKIDPLGNLCSPSTPLEVYGQISGTGACVWVDPKNEFIYIFLSNSGCPNAWNDKITALKIRSRIQETIYKSME